MQANSETLAAAVPLQKQYEELTARANDAETQYQAAKTALREARALVESKQAELRALLGKTKRVVSDETKARMSASHTARWANKKAAAAVA